MNQLHNESSAIRESEKQLRDLELPNELTEWLVEKNAVVMVLGDETKHPTKIIKFRHEQSLPLELPEGYCYIGGTARSIVLKELDGAAIEPRDTDIVGIREFNPDENLAFQLAEQYMSDDAQHGYGVKVESLNSYMRGRDFILNETLVHDDEIYATPRALQCLSEKLICPTEREQHRWYNEELDTRQTPPKLIMKSLRMALEFENYYGEARVSGIEDWEFSTGAVPAFFIALQLERAFERGDRIALGYFNKLIEYGVVTTKSEPKIGSISADSPQELAVTLNWHMLNDDRNPFEFTDPSLNTGENPEEWLRNHPQASDDALYEYYETLAESYNKRIKNIPNRLKR